VLGRSIFTGLGIALFSLFARDALKHSLYHLLDSYHFPAPAISHLLFLNLAMAPLDNIRKVQISHKNAGHSADLLGAIDDILENGLQTFFNGWLLVCAESVLAHYAFGAAKSLMISRSEQ